MFMLPSDLQQNEGEDDHGPPDTHDEAKVCQWVMQER